MIAFTYPVSSARYLRYGLGMPVQKFARTEVLIMILINIVYVFVVNGVETPDV